MAQPTAPPMTVREMLAQAGVDLDQRPAAFNLHREAVEVPSSGPYVQREPGPWLDVSFTVPAERRLTPNQWLQAEEFAHLRVVNCDGWTLDEWQAQEPLTRGEFVERLSRCTLDNANLRGGA